MKLNPHRETNFEYERILIGSSVEAMLTAFIYEIPIFADLRHKPLPFYHIPEDVDLSRIKIQNEITLYTHLAGKKEARGLQRTALWDILAFRLNLMGLMPFHKDFQNIHSEDIPIQELRDFRITSNGKIINIKSEDAILFDYPRYVGNNKVYYVNDYITIHNVFNENANILLSNDIDSTDTVGYETVFYNIPGNNHGCCVKSIIDEDKIDLWKNSESSVKMRTDSKIYWNFSKNYTISLDKREKAPILNKLFEVTIDEIVNYDVLDKEFA